VTQVVVCLPSKCEMLSSNPSTTKKKKLNTLKQPRCKWIWISKWIEWMNHSVIQTMKYYSTLKNELSSHEKTWRRLKSMWETNLKRLHSISFKPCDILKKAKLWEQNKMSGVSRGDCGGGGGKGEWTKHRWFFKALKILCVIL
jgi:hypothetical protein